VPTSPTTLLFHGSPGDGRSRAKSSDLSATRHIRIWTFCICVFFLLRNRTSTLWAMAGMRLPLVMTPAYYYVTEARAESSQPLTAGAGKEEDLFDRTSKSGPSLCEAWFPGDSLCLTIQNRLNQRLRTTHGSAMFRLPEPTQEVEKQHD
jgi:hypothetical protein